MAKTPQQRKNAKRDERVENMRKQIASGDLIVRQMTREERKRWDEQSAAATRHMTSKERTRRSAAQEKRTRLRRKHSDTG